MAVLVECLETKIKMYNAGEMPNITYKMLHMRNYKTEVLHYRNFKTGTHDVLHKKKKYKTAT